MVEKAFCANERFSIDENIAWRRVKEQGFLITRDGKWTHIVNRTGVRILELVSTGRNFGEIVGEMCNEFEVAGETATDDVAEFLGTLVARRIVVREQSFGGRDG